MNKFLQALERADYDQALRHTPSVANAQREAVQPVSQPDQAGPCATALPPDISGDVDEQPVSQPEQAGPCATALPADISGDVDEYLVSLLTPNSFAAEQYRALRHVIEQRHKETELSIIAVSSPGVHDGKTTTSINLAGTLAQAPDARVLLVDGDLRKASMAARLGLRDRSSRPGLVDAILDPKLALPAVVHELSNLNLSVLTAGHPPAAPYEVLKSPRLGELFAEARRRFDYIIVDTPPLVSLPDCRVIGKWVDAFLIVVTAHRTPRKLLEESLNVLEPTKIVGLVFNGDDRHPSRKAYTSYGTSGTNGRRHFASSD